jgi:hypothetical protein
MKTEQKRTAVRRKERFSRCCAGTPICGIPTLNRCGHSAGHPAGFRPTSFASIRPGAGDRMQGRSGVRMSEFRPRTGYVQRSTFGRLNV